MALVKKIIWDSREVQWKSETVCSVRAQKIHNEIYIQLNTYGSNHREVIGQSSQALTFNREMGTFLRDMLLEVYPLNTTETPNNALTV
jgi:hypothetical protein